MITDPKISFIVSAWNRPLALNLCLLSLILQEETSWEAIVTDNSTDPDITAKHKEICKIDERISYLYTADIAGICCYTSAEVGATYAKGEWIGFPSDDSFYSKYYASKLLRQAEKDNLELVYCNIVMEGPENGCVLDCKAQGCHIDKTNFLLKRSRFISFPRCEGEPLAADAPADGWLIDELVAQGIRHGKVGHACVVHS